MYKIKITNNELDKLKRDHPQARFVHLGDVFFGVENIPESAILKYQVALKAEQAEQIKQQDADTTKQNEATKQTDIASVMKILITSTIQPILEETRNTVKKEILDEINLQVSSISNNLEELIKKTEKETIDLTRQVDEISNKLATIKNLNEDEQQKILDKLAKMNQYLRDIPKI